MYLCDYHTHTHASPDGNSPAEEMASAALERGFSEIVITDHFDVAEEPIPEYADFVFDLPKLKREVEEAAEKYRGRLKVKLGIELGQGHHIPEMARELLESAEFDFVLGSLHNAFRKRDYYFIPYREIDCDALISEYVEELYEMVKTVDFDSAAHLTYPLRYLKRELPEFSLRPYYDGFAQVMRVLIERGKAMEVNTSTLRKGAGFTMPPDELIRLYRELGGELLTVGSDAHAPEDVGADVAEVRRHLSELGFRYLTVYERRKPKCIPLI